MIKEFMATVAERPEDECATLVLSAYKSEDAKKIGLTVAAHGKPIAICAILVQAMEEDKMLKDSIKMAGEMYDLMNRKQMSDTSFPFTLPFPFSK